MANDSERRSASLRSPTSTIRRPRRAAWQPLFAQIAETADVLLLGGDLTDYGLADEARILAKDLAPVKIPVVAVLGNHDFEAGEQDEIVADPQRRRRAHARRRHVGVSRRRLRRRPRLLRRLRPRRARTVGREDHQGVRARSGAGSAEARGGTRATDDRRTASCSCTTRRFAETVEGESLEIFPFLGSSRLEDPLSRFRRDRGVPRSRAQGCAGREDADGNSGVQRRARGAEGELSRIVRRSDSSKCRRTRAPTLALRRSSTVASMVVARQIASRGRSVSSVIPRFRKKDLRRFELDSFRKPGSLGIWRLLGSARNHRNASNPPYPQECPKDPSDLFPGNSPNPPGSPDLNRSVHSALEDPSSRVLRR